MRIIKPHNQTGFAIVEVLIATVVLAIGFIELTRAFSNISSVAVRAVAMTRASNLSHATMERVMAQNFDARGNDLEFGDYALNFDGTNNAALGDYVDVGDVHSNIQTISFWIQTDDVDGTRNVIDLDGTAYILIEAGEVTTVGITTPTYYINAVAGEQTITTGTWYHVAVTTANPIDADDVDIGRVVTASGSDDDYFDGKIDEVRLWDDVRTADEIKASYNRSLSDPYEEANLKLYLRMNNGTGTVAFDHSSSMDHGTITNSTIDPSIWASGSISWTSNSNLGAEGEANWSENNDVDDFYKTGASSLLDDDFSGLGGRIYVKYVSINTEEPRDGTVGNPYTFDDSATPTDYKQITVKVGIPGTVDSTQLDAIKAAKVNQGYRLDFSPYGS